MSTLLNIRDLSTRGGYLYYHPSRLTINDWAICVSAVVLPDLLFLLLIFSLPGIKHFRYSLKLITPVILIVVISCFMYIIGRQHLAGGGVSLAAGIYFFMIRLLPLFFLVEGTEQKRSDRIILFIKVAMVYITASFVIDALFLKTYNDHRQLVLLGHLEPGNSTNYINMLALGISVLLLLKDKTVYLYILLTFIISFIWDNRTGLLCCGLLLTLRAWQQSKLLTIGLIILLSLSASFVINNTRLGEQGLDSPRWLSQLDALNDLYHFQKPFGGYDNYLGDTEWLHNIYLDAYRVAGVIPVMLMLVYTLIPFFSIRRDRRLYRIFCLLLTLAIAMSSVMFEGTPLEFIFLFILLYNSLLILPQTKLLRKEPQHIIPSSHA